MQTIIPAIPLDILEKELSKDRFVRVTNNGSNHLYIVNHHNAPNVVREIGRLREVTFRESGGGTGLDCDLDHFDTNENCYEQLIAWNPEDKEMIGGYRFIECRKVKKDQAGNYELATAELFSFSKKFVDEYMPYTIELGRSFVQPKYQPRPENRKGLFSLDNLWDGLGAIHIDYPEIKYFFGKVTMYPHFQREARDMILHFMNYFFPDNENLVSAIYPINIENDMSAFAQEIKGLSYKEAHKILNQYVRARGENIPPLVNAYMNLSATMRTFGTSVNEHFGDVEETGILVTLSDIYESKKERH
ncbi:MAG: GNAT family N-acetyltransferase, partial [Bacteroidia bacterium]